MRQGATKRISRTIANPAWLFENHFHNRFEIASKDYFYIHNVECCKNVWMMVCYHLSSVPFHL